MLADEIFIHSYIHNVRHNEATVI